jgi:CNT family concentrative nucleoside transporter
MSEWHSRAAAALGLFVLIALGWLLSEARQRVPWRSIAIALAIQLGLAALLLRTPVGTAFFHGMNAAVGVIMRSVAVGSDFVFGELGRGGFSFALQVLPVIIVMGSLFGSLYHVGVLQRVVSALARPMARLLGISGAESLATAVNVFLGMTESALVVAPYLERMTRSELFLLMTAGMATVAGSVLVAYAAMLGGDFAGHLATASLISAPAAVLFAKLMLPETQQPASAAGVARVEIPARANLLDAAAAGALDGLRLATYVGGLLIAFVSLVALANAGLGALGTAFGKPALSLEGLLGTLFAPLAYLMGVPWSDATEIGALLGVKTVLNEFLAYSQLAAALAQGSIEPRSGVIASYALCGFANFGSVGILIGGVAGLAPSRRAEVAELGLLSIVSGSLASFMTACIAAILL